MPDILTDIPFEFNFDRLLKMTRVRPNSADATDLADLVERVRTVARPKALVKACYIDERGAETVTIDGVTFTSRALRTNLSEPERVFAYIATCGTEADQLELPPDDFLAPYWLDILKTVLLGAATIYLADYLERRYALGKTATMNPGSGDATVWPIEQQRGLFALLGDVKAAIGVTLSESCLMSPNKTVSGIRFSTEVDFRTCQLCHRENCPNRRAPFDPELWESIEHCTAHPDAAEGA